MRCCTAGGLQRSLGSMRLLWWVMVLVRVRVRVLSFFSVVGCELLIQNLNIQIHICNQCQCSLLQLNFQLRCLMQTSVCPYGCRM